MNRFRTTQRKRLHEGLRLLEAAKFGEQYLGKKGVNVNDMATAILRIHAKAQVCFQLAKGEV